MNSAQPISRGRAGGVLLMLLGAWGAVIPFVGPYFGYAYTPDKAWAYTSGRLWLSIVPGAVAFLGGLFVLASGRTAVFGAFLAALGGAWFVLGQSVIAVAFSGNGISAGSPVVSAGSTPGPATMRFLEGLGFFYGLGVVIVFYAALAIGRTVAARRTAARIYRDGPVEPAETDVFHSAY
jgi:hypothetical protein